LLTGYKNNRGNTTKFHNHIACRVPWYNLLYHQVIIKSTFEDVRDILRRLKYTSRIGYFSLTLSISLCISDDEICEHLAVTCNVIRSNINRCRLNRKFRE